MARTHSLYEGFNPILSKHKRDIPTLTKYLQIASRAYYLSTILSGWFAGWLLGRGVGTSTAEMILIPLALMIPPAALMYLLSVYRVFLHLLPSAGFKVLLVKVLYGLWLVLFFLVNCFQLVFVAIAGEEVLFHISSLRVTQGQFTLFTNAILALIGEALLRVIMKKISTSQPQAMSTL